jgi:hypothetical protein
MATKKLTKAAKRVVEKTKKTAAVRRSGVGAINLPDGYKVIERAPNWDVDADPVINGVRGETTELTFKRGTPNEYDAECFVVNDKTLGEVAVWRSGGLAQLFDETSEGDEVYIEFLGYGDAEGENAPPKLFRCAVKPSKRNPF